MPNTLLLHAFYFTFLPRAHKTSQFPPLLETAAQTAWMTGRQINTTDIESSETGCLGGVILRGNDLHSEHYLGLLVQISQHGRLICNARIGWTTDLSGEGRDFANSGNVAQGYYHP